MDSFLYSNENNSNNKKKDKINFLQAYFSYLDKSFYALIFASDKLKIKLL